MSKRPALCPDFLIETYLDHAGEKFCLEYDANSLLYVSKAMDLFDLGADAQRETAVRRAERAAEIGKAEGGYDASSCGLQLPETPYEEQDEAVDMTGPVEAENKVPVDLVKGLAGLKEIPTLVMGVASDILFPAWQQREIAEALRQGGNGKVTHVELGEDKSLFGHDTFLLDLEHIGGNLKKFLG